MLDRPIDVLADDPLVLGDRGADQVGRQLQHRIGAEAGRQALVRQLDAVALDPREADRQRIPVRADGLHPDGLPRQDRFDYDRLGGEVERDAEHVGVFDVEQPLLVQFVGLPP